jgi:fructokinase
MPSDPARPVVFGEVLFDRFPDGSVVLGGAPFNVTWHLQAFGLAPLFISRVGDDPLGRRIRNAMAECGMDATGLQVDPAHPTGTVEVTFADGEPHFDIVAERAYDFVDSSNLPPVDEAGLVVHGTLALRHPVSRDACQRLREHLEAPAFVDVNLRAPWWEQERVAGALRSARWAKLNGDELSALATGGTVEERMSRLQQDAGLELLVVTLGERGALARTASGGIESVAPTTREISVVDTVGAGDAFAAVLVLGLLRSWPLAVTLPRAQAFAEAVVGVRGATVTDPAFYTAFRETWELA